MKKRKKPYFRDVRLWRTGRKDETEAAEGKTKKGLTKGEKKKLGNGIIEKRKLKFWGHTVLEGG